jgi:acetyltransferase-like isoleucine patch superfamily enzyme
MSPASIRELWTKFWMRYAGLSYFGRLATRLAIVSAPPYKARQYLKFLNRHGYISPAATIYHSQLRVGAHVFIGDRVMIFEAEEGGPVEIGDRADLWGDSLLETGRGGTITIGANSRVNRGVQLISYIAPICIGRDVGLGANAALYSYDHGIAPGQPYLDQPLETKGPIVIDDHAWIGVGVIILSGVRIGKHAVVAAGSVVTHDVPDGAIAMGVPARVVKMRDALTEKEALSPNIAAGSEGREDS